VLRWTFALLLLLTAAPTAAGRLGASVTGLTNTAQVLLQKLPTRVVTLCVIVGGAAAETVIFRPVGGGTIYETVAVAAGEVVGRQLNANIPASGIEVVTQNAAGDVTVECVYRLAPS
jgi:hypothetical protein